MTAKAKSEARPAYLRNSGLYAVLGFIVGMAAMIFRMTFSENGSGYPIAVLAFLLIVPALHIASFAYGVAGIRSGGSRKLGFFAMMFNLVMISFGFALGAAALAV